MSLINEALKKAGRDAERSAPRAPLTPSPSQVPPRRLFSPRVALLALVVVAGAALLVLIRGAFQSEPQAPNPSPPAVLVGEPADEATEPPVPDGSASTPIATAGTVAEESPTNDPDLRPELENQEPLAATKAAAKKRRGRRQRQPAASKTTLVQDASSSLDGASFLKRAQIPGGGTLELSGIAWSETQPVAVISGSVVSPGERVKGFKVIRINADSVDLEGANERFTIRLR